MTAAGKRDRRIRLERNLGALLPDAPVDELNQATADWQLIEEVWARKVESAAAETDTAGQVKAERIVTFEIGFREDFSPTSSYRVVFAGRAFDVLATVEGSERRASLILTCVSRAE